jgi:hypothetical protein
MVMPAVTSVKMEKATDDVWRATGGALATYANSLRGSGSAEFEFETTPRGARYAPIADAETDVAKWGYSRNDDGRVFNW